MFANQSTFTTVIIFGGMVAPGKDQGQCGSCWSRTQRCLDTRRADGQHRRPKQTSPLSNCTKQVYSQQFADRSSKWRFTRLGLLPLLLQHHRIVRRCPHSCIQVSPLHYRSQPPKSRAEELITIHDTMKLLNDDGSSKRGVLPCGTLAIEVDSVKGDPTETETESDEALSEWDEGRMIDF